MLVYVIWLKCLKEHLFHPQKKMTDFIPNKVFLRGVLLHYFNITRDASKSRSILVKVYGEHAISERACHNWFKLLMSLKMKIWRKKLMNSNPGK